MAEPLQTIQEQVTALTHSVEHLQSDVQTLKAEMQDVKQDVKSLQDGQVALRTAVANLAGAFEQMDKRLGDFTAQIDKRFSPDYSST